MEGFRLDGFLGVWFDGGFMRLEGFLLDGFCGVHFEGKIMRLHGVTWVFFDCSGVNMTLTGFWRDGHGIAGWLRNGFLGVE